MTGERLDVVEMLVGDSELRLLLRGNHLRRLPDLRRLSTRLQRRSAASLHDCYRVYQAVGVLPELIEALEASSAVQHRPELCAELFTNPIKVRCGFFCSPTHTHTHPFNGPLSGTTQVSRYQKGKTNLDFTEATDSEWQ